MSVQGIKGTLLAVDTAAPATYNQAGYEALTWVNVGYIEDLGEFGPQFEEGQFDPIGTESRVYFKGTRDDGNLSLVIGHVLSDTGQDALEAAAEATTLANASVSVRITMNTGRVYYDRMAVFGFRHDLSGGNNNAVRINCTMRPSTGNAPVKVDS